MIYGSEALLRDLSAPAQLECGEADFVRASLAAILSDNQQLDGLDYRIEQTGSARNGTAVGSSDLDYLVVLHPPVTAPNHTYRDRYALWQAFSSLLETSIQKPWTVQMSEKCLKLTQSDTATPIDILPCLSIATPYGEAVEFWTNDRNPKHIISFPSLHRQNGASKDVRTNGNYTRFVRTLKATRNDLEARGDLAPESARSHHLECLVNWLPDEAFGGEMQETADLLRHNIGTDAMWRARTVNNRFYLFGQNTIQWQPRRANVFFRTLLAR